MKKDRKLGLVGIIIESYKEFKKESQRYKRWAERNKKWLKEQRRQRKWKKEVLDSRGKLIRFDSFDEAFDYWFYRYENLPRWLRNYFMDKGMSKSGYPYTNLRLGARLKEIDETRLKIKKRAFVTSFEYLFIFTYDSAKNGQRAFKRRIKRELRILERRNGWKYVGVWKQSKNNGRVYLQALVKTKDGEIIGGIERVRDFQKRGRWLKTTMQSRYFNERFGRTIVETLDKGKEEEYQYHVERFLESYNEENAKRIWGRKIPRRLRRDLILKVRIEKEATE